MIFNKIYFKLFNILEVQDQKNFFSNHFIISTVLIISQRQNTLVISESVKRRRRKSKSHERKLSGKA